MDKVEKPQKILNIGRVSLLPEYKVYTVVGKSNSGGKWKLENGDYISMADEGFSYQCLKEEGSLFNWLTETYATKDSKEEVEENSISKIKNIGIVEILENCPLIGLSAGDVYSVLRKHDNRKSWCLDNGKSIALKKEGSLFKYLREPNSYFLWQKTKDCNVYSSNGGLKIVILANESIQFNFNQRAFCEGDVHYIVGDSTTGLTWKLDNGESIKKNRKVSCSKDCLMITQKINKLVLQFPKKKIAWQIPNY